MSVIGFTPNFKYILTKNGVIVLDNESTNKNILSYNYNNLSTGIDIMRETVETLYKNGKIDIVEYSNYSRKFLYKLVETIKPNNQINILKEWEDNFGSKLLILNESDNDNIFVENINKSWDSLKIILEQWYNPTNIPGYIKKGVENIYGYGKEKVTQGVDWTKQQYKDIQDKGLLKYLDDKSTSIWNDVKKFIKDTGECFSQDFAKCFFEGLRTVSTSAIGSGLLLSLEFVPALGHIPTVVVFGSLLAWDLYKVLSGKYEWDFMDIIIDSIALLIPASSTLLKRLATPLKSVGDFVRLAISKGGILLKILDVMKNNIPRLVKLITDGGEWFFSKTGMKFFKTISDFVSSKLQGFVDNLISQTDEFLSKKVGSLNNVERVEYDKLFNSWKENQKKLGRSNMKPGLEVRSQMVEKAKNNVLKSSELGLNKETLNKFLKSYVPSRGGKIPTKKEFMRYLSKNIGIAVLFCAALGLDGVTCTENNVMKEIEKLSDDETNKLIDNLYIQDIPGEEENNQFIDTTQNKLYPAD